MQLSSQRHRAILYQVAAALIFLATLFLVKANVESGMNDDWSFVRTVHDSTLTGPLRYNGWSSPLIGFQAYWAELFVKWFGFSFLAVRASSYVLTLLFIPVLWSLLRTAELSEQQSFFGLLVYILSPVGLPVMSTFMTDVPAFLFFAAGLLAAMKAWSSEQNSRAMKWIAVCTLCCLLSGSIRQVYWLAGVCFLLTLALVKLHSLKERLSIAACIVITLAFGIACSNWLQSQPYVPYDNIPDLVKTLGWNQIFRKAVEETTRNLIGACVLCVPFSLPFAYAEMKRTSWKITAIIVVAEIVAVYRLGRPLPWLGNMVTMYGVLLPTSVSVGDRPVVLSAFALDFIGLIGLLTATFTILSLLRFFRHTSIRQLYEIIRTTSVGRLLALTTPFFIGYLLALAYRATAFGLYDRYMIPLVFVAGTAMLGINARRGVKISAASWTIAALFAIFAIATTHDYFAEARAKLAATEQVLQSGKRPESVLSSFEFDLWNEADRAGHINVAWLRFPKGSYRQTDDCNGEADVQAWWRSMAPSQKAEYVVSISYLDDLKPSPFHPVEFQRWLPFSRSSVYIGKVDNEDSPLTCEAGPSDPN